ncbi:MAG: hypothetical protein H5T95_14070 [Firmicutes bacterium]|nr:hypothetical protein [Bacillota bacterium]
MVLSVTALILTLLISIFGILFNLRSSQACSLSMRFNLFDLKTRDEDEHWSDGTENTWATIDMIPGKEYPFETSFVQLRQYGLVFADHLEIGMGYSLAESCKSSPTMSADDMARMMIITKLEYYSSSWRIDLLTEAATGNPPAPSGYRPGDWSVRDVDGDGVITFCDFKADPLDDLPPPRFWEPDCKAPYIRMSVKFSEKAGNAFMGVGLNVSVAYTLNQCSSQ